MLFIGTEQMSFEKATQNQSSHEHAAAGQVGATRVGQFRFELAFLARSHHLDRKGQE